MSNPKNHHFVPQVYLEQFENSSRQLYTLKNSYHRKAPFIRLYTKAMICYKEDMYKVTDKSNVREFNITDPYIIERRLNKLFEDNFGKLVKKLLSPLNVISFDDARNIILSLLVFKQRNPVFRSHVADPKSVLDTFTNKLNEFLEHREVLENILNRVGSMNIDQFAEYGKDYIEKYADNPETPNSLNNGMLLRTYFKKDSFLDEVATKLLSFEWYIFETSHRFPFITSDNPGFSVHTDDSIYNTGFDGMACFNFPLSPKIMLVIMCVPESQIGSVKKVQHRVADDEFVSICNRATFTISYSKVISNSETILHQVWRDICRFRPDLNVQK